MPIYQWMFNLLELMQIYQHSLVGLLEIAPPCHSEAIPFPIVTPWYKDLHVLEALYGNSSGWQIAP